MLRELALTKHTVHFVVAQPVHVGSDDWEVEITEKQEKLMAN